MRLRVSTVEAGNEREALRGTASVTFDEQIKVTGIRIIEGKNGALFVAMPSYKAKDGEYKDICNPISAEFREALYGCILAAFEENPGTSMLYNADSKEKLEVTARVTPIEGDNGVKAIASVYLNNGFGLNNVTVRESKEGKLYAAAPSYRTNERNEDGTVVYRNNFYPVTKKAQEQFQKIVLSAYEGKLQELSAAQQENVKGSKETEKEQEAEENQEAKKKQDTEKKSKAKSSPKTAR